MHPFTRALTSVRHTAAAPVCSSDVCAAARWQLWARRSTGFRLNGDWYCSEDCLNIALAKLVVEFPARAQHVPSAHVLPLGLLMLARGIIDELQLRQALAAKNANPSLRIGECLCQLGAISEGELTRGLAAQHSLPVLAAASSPDHAMPLAMMEHSRCLAFRGIYHTGLMYLGFDGVVDRSLIAAAEKVLDCECEPCIVSSLLLEQHIEWRRREKGQKEMVFETRSSDSEILRTINSYVLQIRADQVRVASSDTFLWAKLWGTRTLDLLFRI